MSASRVQLATTGVNGQRVQAISDMSYFVKKFAKHSKFAMETMDVQFDQASADFGSLLSCTIPRNGHLIHGLHLNLTLPALTSVQYTGPSVVNPQVSDRSNIYTDSIGHAIIEYAELIIGGQTVDRITGEYLHITSQTTIDNSCQHTMKYLVGDTSVAPSITSNLIGQPSQFPRYEYHFDTYEYNPSIVYGLKPASSVSYPLRLKVPLTFYFTQSSRLAIPLVAITRQEVEIRIKFRPLDKLIAGGRVWNWVTPTPLSPLETSLSVEYVFIDENEIAMIKQKATDYIITQSQVNEIAVPVETLPNKSLTKTYFASDPSINVGTLPNTTGQIIAGYSVFDTMEHYTLLAINKLDTNSQSHQTWLVGIRDGSILLSSGHNYAQYNVIGSGTKVIDSYYKYTVTYLDSNNPTSNISNLFGTSAIDMTYTTPYLGYYQDNIYNTPATINVNPGKFKMGATSGLNRMNEYTAISINKTDVFSVDNSILYSNIVDGFIELYTNADRYVRYSVTGSPTLNSDTYSLSIQYSEGNGDVTLPVYRFFGYSGLLVRYITAQQHNYVQNGSNVLSRRTTSNFGRFRFEYNTVDQISNYTLVNFNNRDLRGDATDWLRGTPGNWMEFRLNNKFALYYVVDYTIQTFDVIGDVYRLQIIYKDSNYPGSNTVTLFSDNDVSVMYYNSTPSVTNPISMRLNFINPIKELFFLIQDDVVVNQINDYFNFYNNSTEYFLGDQLDKLEIVFNDETFLSSTVASKLYLGDVQFMNNHTRRPNANMRIYNYSFALDPENVLPTGQMNFSRILNQNVTFWLTSSYNTKTGLYSSRTIRVYARSYNILRVRDGVAGLLFLDKA